MNGEIPLYIRIRKELLKKIKKITPGFNKLETEKLLAEHFGTTRATIREAMNSLIRDGFITRWQGKGNFGHPSAANLQMRFDITSDFRRLLQDCSGKPAVRQENIRISVPSPEMLKRMPESAEEGVVVFDWIYTSGGDPVIHCRVEVLRHLLPELPVPEKGAPKLADYLKRHCGVDITNTTTWLRAGRSAEAAAVFGLPYDVPMLVWDEIFYDLYDRKVCFNTIHFHPEKIDLSMLQNI